MTWRYARILQAVKNGKLVPTRIAQLLGLEESPFGEALTCPFFFGRTQRSQSCLGAQRCKYLEFLFPGIYVQLKRLARTQRLQTCRQTTYFPEKTTQFPYSKNALGIFTMRVGRGLIRGPDCCGSDKSHARIPTHINTINTWIFKGIPLNMFCLRTGAASGWGICFIRGAAVNTWFLQMLSPTT